MLRITEETTANGQQRLRLEGRVVGPWIAELGRLCEEVLGSGRGLLLDLDGVSFLEPEAVRLVRALSSRGVALLGGTPFVREQIEGGSDELRATD